MENNLQIFNNPEFGSFRSVNLNGQTWFIGKDVATILGYKNARQALHDNVDDDDKMDGVSATDSIGRNQNYIAINESGLYSLVMSSKLPNAKKFKRWVTSEVLPTIRRHGAYMTQQAIENALTDPDTIIQLATTLKQERSARLALEAQIESDRPKVLFSDAVSASQTSILIGDFAKILRQNGVDIGQKRLFQWLRDNGWLIKQKGESWNMPTQKSMDKGLFQVKETTISHSDGHIHISKTVKVTGRGQVYFTNLLMFGGANS